MSSPRKSAQKGWLHFSMCNRLLQTLRTWRHNLSRYHLERVCFPKHERLLFIYLSWFINFHTQFPTPYSQDSLDQFPMLVSIAPNPGLTDSVSSVYKHKEFLLLLPTVNIMGSSRFINLNQRLINVNRNLIPMGGSANRLLSNEVTHRIYGFE